MSDRIFKSRVSVVEALRKKNRSLFRLQHWLDLPMKDETIVGYIDADVTEPDVAHRFYENGIYPEHLDRVTNPFSETVAELVERGEMDVNGVYEELRRRGIEF